MQHWLVCFVAVWLAVLVAWMPCGVLDRSVPVIAAASSMHVRLPCLISGGTACLRSVAVPTSLGSREASRAGVAPAAHGSILQYCARRICGLAYSAWLVVQCTDASNGVQRVGASCHCVAVAGGCILLRPPAVWRYTCDASHQRHRSGQQGPSCGLLRCLRLCVVPPALTGCAGSIAVPLGVGGKDGQATIW